jgi:hypothetical protein
MPDQSEVRTTNCAAAAMDQSLCTNGSGDELAAPHVMTDISTTAARRSIQLSRTADLFRSSGRSRPTARKQMLDPGKE